MGSYASLHYYDIRGKLHFAALFNYKLFGYIEDDECAEMESYKYLFKIRDIPVEVANEPYIHCVCELSKQEAIEFMRLYSKDLCKCLNFIQYSEFAGWDKNIKHLRNSTKLYLCFD